MEAEASDDSGSLHDRRGSGTEGRPGGRGVAEIKGGGIGDEEEEGDGQTPAGNVYEHW